MEGGNTLMKARQNANVHNPTNAGDVSAKNPYLETTIKQ